MQTLGRELGVTRRSVAEWEGGEGPSSYFWTELGEIARRYGHPDLRKIFLAAALDKQRVSAAAWQIAMMALREWQQQQVTRDTLSRKEWMEMDNQVMELLNALDADGTATSDPEGYQLERARVALDKIGKIRSAAVLRWKGKS